MPRKLLDQNLPGLARVHYALHRHRRGGGPAVQVQLVLGGSVPAVDGRGTSALSAQQAERGKTSCPSVIWSPILLISNSDEFAHLLRQQLTRQCDLHSHQIADFGSCGNGIVDDGEECDCGTQCSPNSCCSPVTCRLKADAQCESGPCCDNCKVRLMY